MKYLLCPMPTNTNSVETVAPCQHFVDVPPLPAPSYSEWKLKQQEPKKVKLTNTAFAFFILLMNK